MRCFWGIVLVVFAVGGLGGCTKNEYVKTCEAQTKKQIDSPGTFDLDSYTYVESDREVFLKFTSLNSQGDRVKRSAHCKPMYKNATLNDDYYWADVRR